jgi:antitoxin (DNA-binding transcriptional repressor) of toxin-antitoxin stability system
MKTQPSKSQLKPRIHKDLRQVEKTGESLIVTDHGRPTVELRRYTPPDSDPLERLRGGVRRYDGPCEPVSEDDWETQ